MSSLDSYTSGKNCSSNDDFVLLTHADFSNYTDDDVNEVTGTCEPVDDEDNIWSEMTN